MKHCLLKQKNELLLSGYLGTDPVDSYTKDKIHVAQIRLMQDKYKKTTVDGGATEWIKVKPAVFYIDSFGKIADTIVEYCRVGTYIMCKCVVTPQSWQKDEKWHYSIRLKLTELMIVDNKPSPISENLELSELIKNVSDSGFEENYIAESFMSDVSTLDEISNGL